MVKKDTSQPQEKAKHSKKKSKKSDFYSRVMTEAEQLEMQCAQDITGIDDEIALLRVKIQSILEHDPDNVQLIMNAANTLARLVKTRYKLEDSHKKGLKEAIGNVLKDVAVPLGIKFIETKIK